MSTKIQKDATLVLSYLLENSSARPDFTELAVIEALIRDDLETSGVNFNIENALNSPVTFKFANIQDPTLFLDLSLNYDTASGLYSYNITGAENATKQLEQGYGIALS